jgi:uncharacterized protein
MAKAKKLSSAISPVFIDTSGFFALLSSHDPAHQAARRRVSHFARTRRQAVTTDYVIDETFSLLKARGLRHLSPALRNLILTSKSLRLEWTEPGDFTATADFFLKHLNQHFSFTDCRSFLLMREYKLRDALTTDKQFTNAGFRALLVE